MNEKVDFRGAGGEPPGLRSGGYVTLVSPVIKSGSTPVSPDRQMFRREKKVVFLFILFGLFDPEGPGYVPVGT
ncbi:hypothetical protein BSG1_10703 [Bacillus sp. SG-1]|nr:hypothetical protein BSG1_10703 [Bacillus sp. SG-1]